MTRLRIRVEGDTVRVVPGQECQYAQRPGDCKVYPCACLDSEIEATRDQLQQAASPYAIDHNPRYAQQLTGVWIDEYVGVSRGVEMARKLAYRTGFKAGFVWASLLGLGFVIALAVASVFA